MTQVWNRVSKQFLHNFWNIWKSQNLVFSQSRMWRLVSVMVQYDTHRFCCHLALRYYESGVIYYCNSTFIEEHNSYAVSFASAYTQNIDSQSSQTDTMWLTVSSDILFILSKGDEPFLPFSSVPWYPGPAQQPAYFPYFKKKLNQFSSPRRRF